jgi:predicted NUDIX family NTP pyrophosphohydrolase
MPRLSAGLLLYRLRAAPGGDPPGRPSPGGAAGGAGGGPAAPGAPGAPAAPGAPEVFLVHPGGPFWQKKDLGAWSIPKGEVAAGEEPLAAARREFAEETGFRPGPPFHPLAPVRQPGGKTVAAWAVAGDLDAAAIVSDIFSMEWPPRSGRRQTFPEVDRAGWFSLAEASAKILAGQRPLLAQLAELLGVRPGAISPVP